MCVILSSLIYQLCSFKIHTYSDTKSEDEIEENFLWATDGQFSTCESLFPMPVHCWGFKLTLPGPQSCTIGG